MPPRKKKELILPVIPLRGLMLFPGMTLSFDVGREKSIAALDAAMQADGKIFVTAQMDESVEDPDVSDLEEMGTLAEVRQVMNLPENVLRVLVEGVQRAKLSEITEDTPYLAAAVIPVREIPLDDSMEAEALLRVTRDAFSKYAHTSDRVTEEAADTLLETDDAGELADSIASNILLKLKDRQEILNLASVKDRLEKLCMELGKEAELAKVEHQLQERISQQIEKNQREYYLREQIKAAQTELGDTDSAETDELRKKMESLPLNEEARSRCEKELDRLSKMTPGTPDIGVSRTYIEWILDLPWGKTTEDNLDLAAARTVLEKGHYGLDKVKERIIEYLAVLKMKQDMRGPILCFVGPPGVGKTSIVRAIAEAVGRKFVQVSLGGVRDEAEIRGHRRTYVGAIPGRIISGIKQAGTANPVFLFDEIDKMTSDMRGDPASAMLEVLDAEQNNSFRDHYLELPFDLSRVMFITTANTIDGIPGPLLDRMEVIEVPSYTEEEKLQIAMRHLVPKQIAEHGMPEKSITITEKVMRELIEGYTREAGVRTLERTIGKVMRKSAVVMLEENKKKINITSKVLREYLGAERYTREQPEKEPRIGIVNGLAWTSVGGELLEVECAVMPGKGTLQLTGQLGSVMKESAEAAYTWVRAHADELGITEAFYKDKDVHIHVPEGAVPKDGPSAGVTMTTALVSALTGKPVRQDVAMTGEMTLRGRVLPIGGLKEKSMAAYRAGMHTLIIPLENKKDLEDIPAQVLSTFRVVTADQIGTVLQNALM